MAEVRHNTGAQLNTAQVRTTTQDTTGRRADIRTVVRMDVPVIGFKQTEREAVAQERQIIVHTTARGERRAPPVRLVVDDRTFAVRATQPRSANQSVREDGEVLHRRAEDRTTGDRRHAIVLAIRMVGVDTLKADIFAEVIRATANCAEVNRRVCNAGRLQLPVRTVVRETCENVHAGRVQLRWSGCAGRSLCAQTR